MKTIKDQMNIAENKDWSYNQNTLNKIRLFKGTGMLPSHDYHSDHHSDMENFVHAPPAELKTGWHTGVQHQSGGTSSYIPRIYNHTTTLSRV